MQAMLSSLTEAELSRASEPPHKRRPADTSVDRRPPRKFGGRRKRDASEVAIGQRDQARRDNR